MGSENNPIIVSLDVLEAALRELPEQSPAAARIREAIIEGPRRKPVAYLAQRRFGRQAGQLFTTQPGRQYDQQIYRGPFPVYESPDV